MDINMIPRKMKVSVLIPCYNEEASLGPLHDILIELMDSIPKYTWEILLVNDGSKDKTLDLIKKYRAEDSRFCFLNLSRNFGKEAAMLAGFDYVTGDCVIIMDADLQDPPGLIPRMLEQWEAGYEDVYAKRISRGKEPLIRRCLSLAFYKVLQKSANMDVLPNVGDFRLLDRKCIEQLKNLRESERYTKGIFVWIGFKKKEIVFERNNRVAGSSSFGLLKLFNLAIEGLTSFTVMPLRLATIFGLIISMGAFGLMSFYLIKTLLYGDPIQGFPTLISVVLFLGGVILLSLGVIGEYLGKIYKETKNRPVYIVSDSGLNIV